MIPSHAPDPDPHAPRWHVRPPANWVNDPNGPFRWGDRHHLFYQHNPHAPVHADVHWGHVSSRDLVHWEHHPIALTPTPGGPDEAGCWSGCVVDDDGVPTAVYTGVDRHHTGLGTLCLARAADPGDDTLTLWHPDPVPVVPGPPPGSDVVMFRDPFVFHHAGRRWALVGAGHADGTPSVLLYDCTDLRDWHYRGVFADGRDRRAAEVLGKDATGWECPQLFETADHRWVLVLSLWDGHPRTAAHLVGTLVEGEFEGVPVPRFAAGHGGRLDHGRDLYAPAVLQDRAAGRVLLWGWAWEARPAAESAAAGWAGVLTAPRVMGLAPDGRLTAEPAPELAALRAPEPFVTRPGDTGGADALPATGLPDAYELRLTATELATVGLLRAADGRRLTLTLDPYGRTVTLDRTGWPRPGAHGTGPVVVPVPPADGRLTVRLLVDGSLIELCAGGATATERLYRRPGDVPELTAEGGGLTVTGWEVAPPRRG